MISCFFDRLCHPGPRLCVLRDLACIPIFNLTTAHSPYDSNQSEPAYGQKFSIEGVPTQCRVQSYRVRRLLIECASRRSHRHSPCWPTQESSSRMHGVRAAKCSFPSLHFSPGNLIWDTDWDIFLADFLFLIHGSSCVKQKTLFFLCPASTLSVCRAGEQGHRDGT